MDRWIANSTAVQGRIEKYYEPPQKIIETLKKVEQSGVEEVILYFNVGNKPHAMVKEQMHRFMEEIAPHFKGKHVGRAARAAAA